MKNRQILKGKQTRLKTIKSLKINQSTRDFAIDVIIDGKMEENI